MRYRALFALCILFLWPMQSAAVTRDTFLIRYTQDRVLPVGMLNYCGK